MRYLVQPYFTTSVYGAGAWIEPKGSKASRTVVLLASKAPVFGFFYGRSWKDDERTANT